MRLSEFNSQQQLGKLIMFEDAVEFVSVSGYSNTAVSFCSNGHSSFWDMRNRQVTLSFKVQANCLLHYQRLYADFEKQILAYVDGEKVTTYSLD